MAVVATAISDVRNELQNYRLDCIYNMDETGLFYKFLYRKAHLIYAKNYKTVPGTKSMSAKDRITAYVCTNADSTEKLPMAVLKKSQNPRCSHLGPYQVSSFTEKNARSRTPMFKR